MSLSLDIVELESDFDELSRLLYDAFGEPFNSYRRWFIPVHATVEEAVEASKYRNVQSWKNNKDIIWLKVVDTASGIIVGAAEWEFRDKVELHPTPQPAIKVSWHRADSEEAEFAGKLFTELKGFMRARMTRPHVELEQLVVHPAHRRRGAAKLMLEWGMRKAGELGLEMCVASVPLAVPVYERLGFTNVDVLDPSLSMLAPSPKWEGFLADDLRVFLMWRPAGHDPAA